ncbi:hypothetical protein D3C76_1008840 [compost metagenome]
MHYLTPDQIALGRLLYRRDLSRLITCQMNDYWPGADDGKIIEAKLPRFEMSKLEFGV